MCVLYISVFLLLFHLGNSEDVVRQTEFGLIRGEVRKSRVADSMTEYYYFAGVPYARPPIGSLRFQDPQPPVPWNGVLNTTAHRNTCAQLDHTFAGSNAMGSEDCLYLEVSVPFSKNINVTKKLPVLVWLHGGTFIFSGVNDTGPDYLMEESIILVAVDYRLNVFGFLSTLDENANGNAGLKDQVMAFKWIQKNIENFGGDPNKVTIFGCSAGSVSVQLHMLSPKSRGLFHRAISQSGTPLNPWSFQRNPLEMTRRLASGFGINSTDNKVIVKELQKIPYDQLLKMIVNKNVMGPSLVYNAPPFSVSIESHSESAFLTNRAYKLLKKGKITSIPYIVGYNTEEGSFPYEYVDANVVDLKIYDKNPNMLIPTSMNIPKNSPCNTYTLQQIKNFYFNNTLFSDKTNWINYISQDYFVRGILKSTEMICEQTSMPIYFYHFSYQGKTVTYTGGAAHYAEVQYLLYPRHPHWNSTEEKIEDTLSRKRLIRLWVNFAYYGNPTPYKEDLLQNITWPTYCSKNTFLDIGKNLTLQHTYNDSNTVFWNELFNYCGFPPYYTY